MNPLIATCLFAGSIGGLFYLNRDKSVITSKALWIPVIWFWITGSRSVSAWIGGNFGAFSVESLDDGSPTDAAVFLGLEVVGLAVVSSRSRRALTLLALNLPVVLYWSYSLMSVGWTDVPGIAIKRWIKATGDVIMALVVLTDAQPVAALKRLFSRLGFVLLPVSVLLIRYYPALGRGFEYWGGESTNIGVTGNKNSLGAIAFVLTLGAAWQVLQLYGSPAGRKRSRRLIAQLAIVGIGIWLLHDAHSATAGTCFALAAGVMLMINMRQIRGRPRAVTAVVAMLVVVGGVLVVTGLKDVIVEDVIGRRPDLTGRASDIWPVLIPMAPNVLVGAGFESFWTGARMQKLWEIFPSTHINESHNGYIEVYLNLGLIGVILIVSLFIHGYRRSVAATSRDPYLGSMLLVYVMAAALYNYTEAGFRMLSFPWSFLVLTIMAASVVQKASRPNGRPSGRLSESSGANGARHNLTMALIGQGG